MNIIASLIIALVLPFKATSISTGNVELSVFSYGVEKPVVPDQVLTTTIKDPKHPDEPWTVTTYRLPNESFEAFTIRHKTTVDAIREILK